MSAKEKKNFWETGTVKDIPTLKRNHPHEPAAKVDSMADMKPLYTVEDVAKYFSVNKFTIYHWKGIWIEAETSRPCRFTAQQIEDCKLRMRLKQPLNKRKHG